MNAITITGRATRDPEIKFLDGGNQVCSLSLADNQRTKQGDETIFFDVSVWGKRAEVIAEYVKKGDTITVVGKLAPPQAKGEKVYLKVEAWEFTLPAKARTEEPAPAARPTAGRAAMRAPVATHDADVPF